MNNIFNLKSYFKFLSRNRAYTAINVFGLSVSLMFVILIGAYYWHETHVDSQHPLANRIYALGHDNDDYQGTGGHWRLLARLIERFPEIETGCAVTNGQSTIDTREGEKLTARFMFTDSTFYRLFNFPLLQGDRRTALSAPDKAVVSEDFARRMWGTTDAVGRSFALNDSTTLTVSGIMAPMHNTVLQNYHRQPYDFICRYELTRFYNYANYNEKMSNATGADLYLLTKPGTHLPAKLPALEALFKECWWFYQMPDRTIHPQLIPLDELYLSPYESLSGNHVHGDPKMVRVLLAVGLAILLFALMNYINLTVAQSGFRAKEMATRRLLGSPRSHILLRLVEESTVLCALSFALGLLLAYAAVPAAQQLLSTQIPLTPLITPTGILLTLGAILVIGLVTGIAPALILSSTQPIDVVRGTFRRRTKMLFSKIFITLQHTITIVLVACALTMVLQINLLIHAPLGYRTDNILDLRCPASDTLKADAFLSAARQLACVHLASAAQGVPIQGGNNNTLSLDSKTISYQVLKGEPDYLKIFGIELEQDNPVDDPAHAPYVNHQTLAETAGLAPQGTIPYSDGRNLTVRGVVRDFHIRSIEDSQRPLLVYIQPRIKRPWEFVLQVTGNPLEAYHQVKQVFHSVYGMDSADEYPFIDQQVAANYEQATRLSHIMLLFAAIAALISLLGLLAMSTYFIQQRSQEIAVRKVFGSTSSEILVKLVRTFLTYVCIAFAVAVPVIHHFMDGWLSTYTYRITLSWWIYAAAGFFCLAVSFITVVLQSYHAANANPVDSIKNN